MKIKKLLISLSAVLETCLAFSFQPNPSGYLTEGRVITEAEMKTRFCEAVLGWSAEDFKFVPIKTIRVKTWGAQKPTLSYGLFSDDNKNYFPAFQVNPSSGLRSIAILDLEKAEKMNDDIVPGVAQGYRIPFHLPEAYAEFLPELNQFNGWLFCRLNASFNFENYKRNPSRYYQELTSNLISVEGIIPLAQSPKLSNLALPLVNKVHKDEKGENFNFLSNGLTLAEIGVWPESR